ncbi:hypothetical protein NMG29_06750 [Streptomyces cocklensis]|uniref:Uncharacterized protein n=1 Tax=Actinacidiphila cocklensis TaxID=887465 RepID=A0A9W4DRR3_9ACTN|nr:hypothetical protein [Actinacidiphila cocklensis]MDD1057931.1 hypothetical protein [Actinacidiphila cocklensis]CAG6392798.1 hypothetical protein SCOCK_180175 [Actinacidiphila cocklensis]
MPPVPDDDDTLLDQVADLVNATGAASDTSLPAVAQDAAAAAADTLSTQLRPE